MGCAAERRALTLRARLLVHFDSLLEHVNMSARCLRLGLVSLLFTLLAACGGGQSTGEVETQLAKGGGGGNNGAVSALAINGFSPSTATPGTEISINGSGLNTVSGAKVGSFAATFVVDSAKKMRVVVPAGAATGRIEISNDSSTALSKTDLVIPSGFQVTSVTPNTVIAPARVNVAGSGLDVVRSARLNGTTLTLAGQTTTSLALDVPAGASTGYLTLVDANAVAQTTAFQIVVANPMTIASFAPASVARGASLTVSGTNLDRATAVEFAGGASAGIGARSGSTSITVTVPSAASSGPISVVGNLNDRVSSSASLTVVIPISVNAGATYTLASAPGSITIPGSGLTAVTGVTIGSVAAAITAKTDTALTLTVPAGVQCGPITLLSSTQPAVAAGAVVVGAGCTVRSAGVEFAQVLSQTTSDSYQRLVPRKTTLVRAYVVSDIAGTPAPVVRVSGFNGATALGTITMTGPATLPQLSAGSALPDSLRYNEAQTFNASLPAAWVGSGLSVRVDIGASLSVNAAPQVGTTTRIDLVLVPLVSGANAPQMPNVATVVDELVRRLTLPRESITVSIRAPYTVTSTSDGVDTSAEWSNVLSELDQLRRSEAPGKHYFGMIKPMVSSGIAGIGYINSVGSSSPYLSSLGWDASRSSWSRTFIHELGHNFSRRHAPCGSVSGADANYPYAGGALSATPLYESIANDVLSPANQYDIMGYCSGVWFSDYNLREVQRFMEAQPQGGATVPAVGADIAADTIVLSGRIDADGVTLDPVQRRRGIARGAVINSDYRARIHTTAGAMIEVPIEAAEVDHVDEKHFYATVPSPGPLARVELTRRGQVMPLRSGGRMRAQAAPTTATAVGPSVEWREVGANLELTWNSGDFAAASITHVAADGRRTVLGLNLRGGNARINVAQLPRGGEFELSLSDGLDAQLIVIKR